VKLMRKVCEAVCNYGSDEVYFIFKMSSFNKEGSFSC
jgi:hypothetical protein